jgi:hypothetical protein
MALSAIFFLAIVFYLLYRFVFNFVVPIARTTRHVRQQFRNMQEGMGQQSRPQPTQQAERPRQSGPTQPTGRSAPSGPEGDYIDFEEIK